MIVIYGLWLPVTVDRLPLFYLFASLFGTTTGSIMSMAPVCISKYATTFQALEYGATLCQVIY